MKFENKVVNGQAEILKRRLGGELIAPITITDFTDGVCKAGSPIGEDGKVANTSSAIGILLNDVYDENPNGAIIKAFATVNLANAEANSGLTIADAVKTALKSVIFE